MTKKIALMLLALVLALATAGCSGSEKKSTLTDAEIDAAFSERISCPQLVPDEKPDEPICTDYADRGLLRICYQGEPGAKLKLEVLADGGSIHYNLKGDGSIEDFSLQYGSGEYTARIMQNKKDNEYFVVESKTFTASISDEKQVYLNAIQNVDWNFDKLPIRDVRKIIAAALEYASDTELGDACTDDVHRYIAQNISYDDQKVYDLEYDYLPDIEKTYLDGKGICYDYASLLAAMLRSINIPTKLVKGYANYNPTVYHAWNEVYLGGKWLVIDATYDATTGKYQPVFKDADGYTKVFEY